MSVVQVRSARSRLTLIRGKVQGTIPRDIYRKKSSYGGSIGLFLYDYYHTNRLIRCFIGNICAIHHR
jgi:hypothetical protein